MSLFAGVVFHDGRHVPDEWRKRVAGSLSRRAEDCPFERSAPGMFACFLDVGALAGNPIHEARDGSFTILAGDPILGVPGRAPTRTRTDDAPLIHADLAHSSDRHLVTCRGDFAAIHYDPSSRRLVLATDKSAIRPVLCHADEEKLVFCSSFRIFRELRLPNLRLDPVGVGIALGGHALLGPYLPFDRSWRLAAGEVLTCRDGQIDSRRYWRWASIGPSGQPEERAIIRAAELLRESIRLRARGSKEARILLSGGLDSRVVASCLLDDGMSVDACTLGPEGSADLAFAKLYARAAGLDLRENPIPRDATFNLSFFARDAFSPDRAPLLLWNGFDGSFQLGHTFYYDPFIPAQRDRRIDEVTALFAQKKQYGWAASRRILREPLASAVETSLPTMLRRFFTTEVPPDPARTIYVYQAEIGNPPIIQHEHQDLDLHRVEYLMPLADFALIEHIMGIDPQLCQRHRFYYRLLDQLPASIKTVPWQSYPTQDPCPVPGPTFPETQWEHTPGMRAAASRRARSNVANVLRGGLPSDVFRRLNTLIVCLLQSIHTCDYNYHLDRIVQLQDLLRMTEPDPPPRGGVRHRFGRASRALRR